MAGWRQAWLGVLALGLMSWPRAAEAIPVFARIYDKPCSACHTVYPQLNPAGEYFRAKGLHSMEAKVKPIQLAPGFDVPGTLPLAISLAVGQDVSRFYPPGVANSTENHFNLEYLALLAGGELGPHLAFLADCAPLFTISQTGKQLENHNLGLGFLQAHAEPRGWLVNVRAGLIELPTGTSPRVHRLSVQPYLVYQSTAFSLLGRQRPADSAALSETQIAVELSGLRENGFALAAGVANGTNNRANSKEEKDVYFRVAQAFGLHRAGFLLYYSPNLLRHGPDNAGLRLGPDVSFYWRQAGLRAQLLANYDDNPTGTDDDFWSIGSFVEGEYRWTPSIVSLARGEAVATPTFDDRDRGGQTRIRRQVWQLTAGAQWLPLENLKLIVEATYGENHEDVSNKTTESWFVTVRVATAFWPLTPPGLDLLLDAVGAS